MAEAAKAGPKPAPTPAAPPPAETPIEPVAPPEPAQPHRFQKVYDFFERLLTITFWMSLGIGLLVLSIFLREGWLPLPDLARQFLAQFFKDFPYFIAGVGLFCVGHARSYVSKEYQAEKEKNRLFLHGWKIPLIMTQVFIFEGCGFYAIGAGIRKLWPKVSDEMLLTAFLLLFLSYFLWYMTAFYKNRFPSTAGFRLALIALVLSALSFLAWGGQFVFYSLIFGFFAVICGLISAVMAPFTQEGHLGTWLRALFLAGAAGLLVPIGYNGLVFGKPHLDLVSLGLITQGIRGTVDTMSFSSDSNRLAFSQKTKEGWFLQVLDPERPDMPLFKVHAGEEAFRPLFVDNGHYLMVDAMEKDGRHLWYVNALTGDILRLSHEVVEPLGDGRPWREKSHQFLYVAKTGSGYALRSFSTVTKNSKTLATASGPFATPSWTAAGDEISYADGETHEPYIFDVASKKRALLTPAMEAEDEAEPGQKPRKLEVTEVISAPDDFRYLFVAKQEPVKPSSPLSPRLARLFSWILGGGKKDETTSLWTVMPDGTKRYKLYETTDEISQFTWTPDAQSIVFQEKGRKLGFFGSSYGIQVLQANTGEMANLMAPQMNHRAPALSNDGAKIAFAGNQGLWIWIPHDPGEIFGAVNHMGIWVAVLR